MPEISVRSRVHSVTPRMRRVSRNEMQKLSAAERAVTPRMRRVSRNDAGDIIQVENRSHASHEACE